MEYKELHPIVKEELLRFSIDNPDINISSFVSNATSQDAMMVMINWIERQKIDVKEKPKSVICRGYFFRCPIDKVTRKPRNCNTLQSAYLEAI